MFKTNLFRNFRSLTRLILTKPPSSILFSMNAQPHDFVWWWAILFSNLMNSSECINANHMWKRQNPLSICHPGCVPAVQTSPFFFNYKSVIVFHGFSRCVCIILKGIYTQFCAAPIVSFLEKQTHYKSTWCKFMIHRCSIRHTIYTHTVMEGGAAENRPG